MKTDLIWETIVFVKRQIQRRLTTDWLLTKSYWIRIKSHTRILNHTLRKWLTKIGFEMKPFKKSLNNRKVIGTHYKNTQHFALTTTLINANKFAHCCFKMISWGELDKMKLFLFMTHFVLHNGLHEHDS